VKLRRTQYEHISFALPLNPDIGSMQPARRKSAQELTLADQSEILLTHSNRLADEDDPCFQRNTPVQILDVVVHEPDAPGSDEMPDCFWRIRAVNE
jgi:hypothetical protein